MYNNNDFNKALDFMKEGMFEQAFLIFKEMLCDDLSPIQQFNLYFEMAMCKAQSEEYEIAEKYVAECIKIDNNPIAYELLETIYELNMHLPANLELAEETFAICKNPFIGKKIIISYFNNKNWNKITQIDILPEYLEDTQICFFLYNAYFEKYENHITKNLFKELIKSISNKKNTEAINEEISVSSLRVMFITMIYKEFSDDDFIKLMNICYNGTIYNSNKIEIDLSLFRTIKLGLISSDFWSHPVGLFTAGLLEGKNNNDIKYYGYYTEDIEDPLNKALSSNFDKFYSVKEFEDKQLEQFILNDHLDILIDLNGSSSNNKLTVLKNRLAPIQITWIGWPMTTAMPNIDYTIVDKHTAPKGAEKYYTEKLIRMNNTALCSCRPSNDNKFNKLESPFLRNGYITFGTFNNPAKYSNITLKCYAKILEQVPNSKLLVILVGQHTEAEQSTVLNLFINIGIPISRIIFYDNLPYDEYMNKHNDVDIMLDTYPFNGATTTTNVLFFGVPIISLYGNHHVSRVGLSMLNAVGLDDLAVNTSEKYIEKAVELANDKERLIFLHKNLRNITKESVLNNNALFSHEMETRFRSIFIDYCISQNNTHKYNHDIKKELLNAIGFIENSIEFFNDDFDTFSIEKICKITDEIHILLLEYYQLIKNKEYTWLDKFYQDIINLKKVYDCNELLHKLKTIWNDYITI